MDNSGEEDGPGAGLTCLAVGQLALCGGEDGKAYVVHVGGKKLVATLPHFALMKRQRQQKQLRQA